MRRSPLLARACLALTIVLCVGCASKPSASGPRGARLPVPGVAEGAGAKPQAAGPGGVVGEGQREGANGSAAEVLPKSVAQHTEIYAHNLETLLAKRAKPKPLTPATRPAEPERVDAEPVHANAALSVTPPVPSAVVDAAAAPDRRSTSESSPSEPSVARRPPAEVEAKPAHVPTSPEKSSSAPTTSDQLLQKLATRVREYPRDTAAQLDYQLLRFLRDESVPELGPIAPLPAEDREVISAIVDGLSNFRAALRGDSDMLQAKKIAPLLEMGDRLRAQGDLILPATALCTNVERFGVYEPMTPARFKPSTQNVAVLYCEVANFSSQLGDGKQWETRLKHEAVLYSEVGLSVWKSKADVVADRSRNRRHDFYIVERLVVPPMPVGRYLLKVSVTDLQMNRVAETTVPVEVAAQ